MFGCWLWTGSKDREGYPIRQNKGGTPRVHRQLWLEMRGEIPDGMEIEHACRVRACVRPSHKYLVTRGQNERLKIWRNRAKIEECPEGHSIRRYSLRTRAGGYVCTKCNKGQD